MQISRLRVGNEDFLVASMIERCPKSMMLRELVKNALEAADRSIMGGKRVEISPVTVEGARKLAIWNTGPGMNAEELHRMCDIASSIGKSNALDQNFGMGAKVASLPSNQHGIRYRSCRSGQVHQVVMGKRNDVYGRLHQTAPDGAPLDVIDATAESRADGRDLSIDWTEVVLLGNRPDQDTVADPYDGSPKLPPSWIAEDLYARFYHCPAGVFLTLHEGCHTLGSGARVFAPLGDRVAAFARHEAVPVEHGVVVHYLYDAPDPDRPGKLLSAHDGLQPARSTAALIYRGELYDVRPSWAWTNEAPVYGIPFGARFFSVHIELPDDFPLLPDGYRQFLRHTNDLQKQIEAREFATLVVRHRPEWLLELLRNFAPDASHTDHLHGEMAAMFKALGIRRRWWANDGKKYPPRKPGDGGVEYEIAPQIVPLRDTADIRERGMESKAARFYAETHQLFINTSYAAFTTMRENLEREFATFDDQERMRRSAMIAAEEALTRQVCRKLVYGLAKREIWPKWEIEQATSAICLTLAADDHGSLVKDARNKMQSELGHEPNSSPAESGVDELKSRLLSALDELFSQIG